MYPQLRVSNAVGDMKLSIALASLTALIVQGDALNNSLNFRSLARPFIDKKEIFSKEEMKLLSPLMKPDKQTAKDSKKTTIGINKHIVGGAVSSRGQFPWQAALVMDGDWFCGGSLITTSHILTAAHCTEGATSFSIALGAQDRDATENGRVTVESKRATIHAGWDSQAVKNDISIIYLPSPVSTSSLIKTIRMPRRSYNKHGFVGNSVTISGWGRLSDASENVSTIMYNLRMEVVSLMQCVSLYGKDSVTHKNLCVTGRGEKGTCNGDSGGPLVYRESDGAMTQVGIVSYGAAAGCGAGYPDVFTKVAAYIKWIASKTNVVLRH